MLPLGCGSCCEVTSWWNMAFFLLLFSDPVSSSAEGADEENSKRMKRRRWRMKDGEEREGEGERDGSNVLDGRWLTSRALGSMNCFPKTGQRSSRTARCAQNNAQTPTFPPPSGGSSLDTLQSSRAYSYPAMAVQHISLVLTTALVPGASAGGFLPVPVWGIHLHLIYVLLSLPKRYWALSRTVSIWALCQEAGRPSTLLPVVWGAT